MARCILLFYFLQFLPLITSANAGLNETVANCIDFDMANVEELIFTHRTVKNLEIKAHDGADEDKTENQPFGNLKTDWARLKLLQEALPTDSLLKDKFNHIFRLLLIAHNQATRFLDSSKSTTIQDFVEKQTTVLLTDKNSTDAEEVEKNPVEESGHLSSKNQEIRAELKNMPTTSTSVIEENTKTDFYGFDTTYVESTADYTDAVEIEEVTKAFAKIDEAKKNNVVTNIQDFDPPTNSSTTIVAPISILGAIQSSTAESIFNASTTIVKEEINISTSIDEGSRQSTSNLLSKSASAVEKVTKIILGITTSSPFDTSPTTEKILKGMSPNGLENSLSATNPNIPITKIQNFNSSSSENGLLSTTEQSRDESSLQPAIKMDPVVGVSITEKYPLPTTISSVMPTKSQYLVSTLSDFLTGDSITGNDSILEKTQTKSTERTENHSTNTQLNAKIQDFITSVTTKALIIENTSIGSQEIAKNKELQLGISDKGTKNVSTPHLTSNVSTTDTIVNISNMTSTFEDPEIKLTTQRNENEDSTSEKPISNILSTIDWIKNVSRVTSTIGKNEDNKLSSQNNQTTGLVNEKSIADVSATRNPTEKISNAPIYLEKEKKSEITSSNNEEKSSTGHIDRISNVTPTINNNEDNQLSGGSNQSNALINENTTRNDSGTGDPVKSTPNVSIETEQREKIGIVSTSLNNVTEKLMNVNMSSVNWYTTDSIESTSSVTSKIDRNENMKIESMNNKTKTLIGENPTINLKETTNPLNDSTDVTPSIDNEKIGVTSNNNQKEIPISGKSTSSEWSNEDSTENVQITTPTSMMNEKIKSTSENNETSVSIIDKSIYNDDDTPSTSTLTSVLNTSNFFTNTVQFVGETSVPEVSSETTQYFVSMEPSIKPQESETSTQNYVSEKSTIATNKNEISISTDSGLTANQTKLSNADFSMGNNMNNQNDLEITSKKSEYITNVTDNPEEQSHSENWRTKAKPLFVKNPLNTGSSRSNKIFQDFKHDSDDNITEKNVESPQIVLYETGAGAKTGSVWRPHIERQQPTGNNIWKYDSYPNNLGPYGYGYNQPAVLPIIPKADIRKDEKNPTKFPGQGSRMNLLRSRKRGSANSDVEKQFRWFYRHGRKDTADESRDKENVNTRIKIQCKKTHRR